MAQVNHDWSKMVTEVQNHIGALNWGYRVALRYDYAILKRKCEFKDLFNKGVGDFVATFGVKNNLFLHCLIFCSLLVLGRLAA